MHSMVPLRAPLGFTSIYGLFTANLPRDLLTYVQSRSIGCHTGGNAIATQRKLYETRYRTTPSADGSAGSRPNR